MRNRQVEPRRGWVKQESHLPNPKVFPKYVLPSQINMDLQQVILVVHVQADHGGWCPLTPEDKISHGLQPHGTGLQCA